MATYGVSGSSTYSVSLSGLDQMMSVIPDNLANQISARNVRDIVLTLYTDITGVSSSINNASASVIYYDNPDITGGDFGGIPGGSSFSNVDLQTLFDNLLYKYYAPVLSLSLSSDKLEYGNTSSVVLGWSYTRKSLTPSSAVFLKPVSAVWNGVPNGNVYSYVSSLGYDQSASSPLQSVTPAINTTNVFTFSVVDSTATTQVSATLSYSLKRFWGALPSSSTLTSTASNSGFAYSDVSSLSGELNTSYVMSVTISATNQYPVLVWPTNAVDLTSNPPVVRINGMGDNNWVKTRTNVIFTNQFGYTASYDVWRYGNLKYSSAEYELT